MKIGTELRLTGQVTQDGVLVDISAWTIRADLRSGSPTGPVVGSFTVSRPSLGVYVLTINTGGLSEGAVFTDVRLIDTNSVTTITDTVSVLLANPVTA